MSMSATPSPYVKQNDSSPSQILSDPLQASAGHRIFTGIDQGDFPGLGIAAMDMHLVGAHVEGDVGGVERIIGEIFLDHISLVAAADDEIRDANARRSS